MIRRSLHQAEGRTAAHLEPAPAPAPAPEPEPVALMSGLGSKLGKLRTRLMPLASGSSLVPGLGRRAGSSPQMSRAYSAILERGGEGN